MENFEFVSPTHFVFGRGAEEQVGEKLAAAGAKRVLVHFGGGSAVASGLIDRVGASLDAAGIEHLELGGVRPPLPGLAEADDAVVVAAQTMIESSLAEIQSL